VHDTTFESVALSCPLTLDMASAAKMETVQEFAPDSCWFNIVYPRYKARIHCTYGGGVALEPVMEDAFKLAYEHEIKADAIEVRKREYEQGGVAITWRIAGNAASPLQFLCTDGEDQFLRGALYFEVRPNGDSLAPVTSRLNADVEHLMANLNWR
jgi:gliding motility-associated lipoprotein GldD